MAAVIVAAIAGVAAPLHSASREMVVSVQVVRRCAVYTSAPEPQNGDARVVAVETTCGNTARVMVDLSMRAARATTDSSSALEPTGEPLYLHLPALPHVEGPDRDEMTVLTVNF